jgi:hypothetical protein
MWQSDRENILQVLINTHIELFDFLYFHFPSYSMPENPSHQAAASGIAVAAASRPGLTSDDPRQDKITKTVLRRRYHIHMHGVVGVLSHSHAWSSTGTVSVWSYWRRSLYMQESTHGWSGQIHQSNHVSRLL